jgi:hypothetical protein
VSTQASMVLTQAAMSSLQADQPVCAAGTQAVNGTCVPDCPDLRRRGVQCGPFCDAADVITPSNGNDGGNGSSSSSSSLSAWLIVVILLGVALVVTVVGVAVQRARHSSRREKHEASSQQQHTMSMFMNPMHAGFASSSVAEDHINGDFQEPTRDVKLDSDLYVQPPSDANEATYSFFRAPADAGTDQGTYAFFRAPAVGRGAQATDASTYSLFRSPDTTA